MRWLADECVDAGLVARLRAAAHDVSYVAEIAAGTRDVEVLRQAQAETRLLLTEDKDFGDLVFRSNLAAPGIILIRMEPGEPSLKWDRLELAITRYGTTLFGRYLVIERARFRSRPLLGTSPE